MQSVIPEFQNNTILLCKLHYKCLDLENHTLVAKSDDKIIKFFFWMLLPDFITE